MAVLSHNVHEYAVLSHNAEYLMAEFEFWIPNPTTSSTTVTGRIVSSAVGIILHANTVFGFVVAAMSITALNVFPVIKW